MAVKIGSARIDENGKAYGGKAGDQTGKEVSTQNWYKHSKGWVLLRAKDPVKAALIAQAAAAGCANNKIGYDQYQNQTLWNKAKLVGYDPSKVKDECETDCARFVRVCCAFAGITASDFYTATEASALMATGQFDKLTANKYTTQSDYLKVGDILVTKTKGHTVVVLSNGPKAAADSAAIGTKLGDRLLKYKSPMMQGDDVKELQAGLTVLGYGKYMGTSGADGWYGTMTATAVRAFQKAYALTVDGEYGPKSHAKLTALLDITQWHEPDNTDPLDEDDMPPLAIDPETGEEIDDTPTLEDDPDADAAMGSGSVNPYPMPTKLKKLGSKGPTVRALQWELQQSGFWAVKVNGKTKNLEVDGVFGEITAAAVKAFQRLHKDASGKKLVVDGKVGPKTREALLAEWNNCAHGGVEDTPALPVDGLDSNTEDQPDISYYDGKPDYSKVTVKHLWIREGDSLRKRDPQFERSVREAVKYGILWSSYLFFRSGTAADARAEVQAFVKRIKATGATPTSLVLDVEVASCKPAAVKAAHAELKKLMPNTQIGIYIGHHLYTKFKDAIALFDYIWVPRYNKWKTPPAHPYQIWQGGFGKFAGINGGKKTVDCNRLKPGWTWVRVSGRRAA